jgi:hypothetical protein
MIALALSTAPSALANAVAGIASVGALGFLGYAVTQGDDTPSPASDSTLRTVFDDVDAENEDA